MKYLLIICCITMIILVYSSSINLNRRHGCVLLCGGGAIPDEAIDLLKSHRKPGQFVVVSCYDICRLRWYEKLDHPIFVLPENLTSIPITTIAGLVIEGGSQWDYLTRLDGKYINLIHKSGRAILGTSAGSMAIGDFYFTAEKDTITSEEAEKNINVCLGHGFTQIKWLNGCIIDTHFTERNRLGRLRVFVKLSGAKFGIGIDEQTALYLDGLTSKVIGVGKVLFIENRGGICLTNMAR